MKVKIESRTGRRGNGKEGLSGHDRRDQITEFSNRAEGELDHWKIEPRKNEGGCLTPKEWREEQESGRSQQLSAA